MSLLTEQRSTSEHGQKRREAFDRRMRVLSDAHRYIGFFAGIAVGIGLSALVIYIYAVAY